MTLNSKSPLVLLYRFFSSFGLATTVLSLLLIVTLLGTLEQVEHGLYDSVAKYFESMWITSIDMGCCLRAMHRHYDGTWNLPVLLPGGYLLMIVLSINMLLGGVVRLKKDAEWLAKLLLIVPLSPLLLAKVLPARFSGWLTNLTPVPRAVGVLVAHLSIIFMLFAGVISLYFKKDGAMSLREGQKSDEFQSFHDSVIEIEKLSPLPAGEKRAALVIDGSHFQDLKAGKGRTFTHKDLPFELMVMNYETNCAPRRGGSEDTSRSVVDGFYLQPMKDNLDQERNMDGAYVKATLKSGEVRQGILWRYAVAPFSVTVGDEVWGITLARRTWTLPFVVQLDKFVREVHPGTEKARRFTSHITVMEDGSEKKRIITMNEPLRSRGYALFQQSFDMQEGDDGAVRQSSTFQVVQNPSDHWPLIACITAGIGLFAHMVWRLARFQHRVGKKEAAAQEDAGKPQNPSPLAPAGAQPSTT